MNTDVEKTNVRGATTNAAAGYLAGLAAGTASKAGEVLTFDAVTVRQGNRPLMFIPAGMELKDLSQWLPAPTRLEQNVQFTRPAAFAQYLNLFGEKTRTIVFADRAGLEFKAVLDYHADPATPSWNKHVATFGLETTDDWDAWFDNNKSQQDQLAFATFLEEHAHNIVEPDASIFTEMALNFDAKKNTQFKSHRRLQDGSVNFVYSEVLTNGAEEAGALKLPEKFILSIAIFEGTAPIRVDARLRYRITGSQLKLSWELVTPEKLIDAVFETYENVIKEATPEHVRAVVHASIP